MAKMEVFEEIRNLFGSDAHRAADAIRLALNEGASIGLESLVGQIPLAGALLGRYAIDPAVDAALARQIQNELAVLLDGGFVLHLWDDAVLHDLRESAKHGS